MRWFARETRARDIVLHDVDRVRQDLEVAGRRGPLRQKPLDDLGLLAQHGGQLPENAGDELQLTR